MPNVIIAGLVAIVALFGGAALLSNNKSGADATQKQTYQEVQSAVEKGAKLYDVRTPEEFAAGFFAEATNLPLQDIQQGKLPDTSKDQKLYVYCRSGNRSGQAKQILEDEGYTNVIDLGGLTNVQAMGGKFIEKEPTL